MISSEHARCKISFPAARLGQHLFDFAQVVKMAVKMAEAMMGITGDTVQKVIAAGYRELVATQMTKRCVVDPRSGRGQHFSGVTTNHTCIEINLPFGLEKTTRARKSSHHRASPENQRFHFQRLGLSCLR